MKSGDSMPTVYTRIFCASSWRERGVEARGAADVVAVGEEDDARRAERRAAHLRDRGDERVVDPRPLGELRRLREDRVDGLAGRSSAAERRSASS